MAKYSGSGWHKQSIRHSNARKYGKAGGTYKTLFRKIPTYKREGKFAYEVGIDEIYKGEVIAQPEHTIVWGKKEAQKIRNKFLKKYKKHYGEAEKGDFDAGEVFRQLGGNRFVAMTGANNFIRDDNEKTIMFKVPHAKDRIKYVRIKLTPNDTYDMEFLSRKGVLLRKTGFVYADKLQEIFTEYTGLDTHL